MTETLHYARFRDQIGHVNPPGMMVGGYPVPLAGGGEMPVGSFPPPPPGREYRLVPMPSGGVEVILASSTGTAARTSDCGAVLRALNAANKTFWDQRTSPGTAR